MAKPSKQLAVQTLIPGTPMPTDDEIIAAIVAARKKGDTLSIHGIMDRWTLDYDKALQLSDAASDTIHALGEKPLAVLSPEVVITRPASLAPGLTVIDNPTEDQQHQIGQWLHAEHVAVSSLTLRCVRLGFAFLAIQSWLLSTRGQNSPKRGKAAKGQGFDAWISRYAADIPRTSVIRYMNMAKAAEEAFKIPAQAQQRLGFSGFLEASPDDLPAKWKKKQEELIAFLDGTSGRALLDMVKPLKPLGGKREKQTDDAEEEEQKIGITPEQAARDLWIPILDGLKREGLDERSWMHLSDEDRTALKGLLKDTLDCINGKLN